METAFAWPVAPNAKLTDGDLFPGGRPEAHSKYAWFKLIILISGQPTGALTARSMREREPDKRVNINEMIRAPKVRVIGAQGDQVGIVSLDEALKLAREAGLDLVEVAREADPPVCRIMDFGRYKYQQSKKLAESRKKAATVQLKEVKFRPKTAEHDYQFKLRNIQRFLKEKNKTKVSLMFKGREIAHADLAKVLLERVVADVGDLGVVEQFPKLEGRFMVMVLAPK